MMRSDEEREEQPGGASDRRFWQRCQMTDAPEDEAARLLDFAAFADGRLDSEEHDRVAALLAADPDAAADVRAAAASDAADLAPAALERVTARACALATPAPPARGTVVAFNPPRGGRGMVHKFAQWGSLAAALVLASWLGFSMGSDTSRVLNQPHQPSDPVALPELFDSPTGFLRDLGEGMRT